MEDSNLIIKDTGLFNIHEFFLDLMIVVFVTALNFFVVNREFSVFTATDPAGLAVLIVLIDVIVPAYLARLRAQILANVRLMKKFISALLSGIVISSIVMMGFVLPILLHIYNILEEGVMAVLLVVGIIAVILSAVSGDAPEKANKPIEESDSIPSYIWILWILCLAAVVIFGLVYMLEFFVNGKVLYGILSVAGMIGGLIIITYGFMEGASRLSGFFASTGYQRYLEPSFIIIMVLLWQEIFFSLTTAGKPGAPAMNLVFLSLSGVLPVRLMAAVEPPIRPINIIVAVAALSWTVYSMYNRP